jgi:hypothetical protein
MSEISVWLTAILAFEFALATFLLFAARGMAWYKRAFGAFASLMFAILFLIFLYYGVSGRARDLPPLDWHTLAVVFLIVNILGFQLGNRFLRREAGFSCFGTIGRLLGCVAVGWAGFALLILGLVLAMGLVSAIS